MQYFSSGSVLSAQYCDKKYIYIKLHSPYTVQTHDISRPELGFNEADIVDFEPPLPRAHTIPSTYMYLLSNTSAATRGSRRPRRWSIVSLDFASHGSVYTYSSLVYIWPWVSSSKQTSPYRPAHERLINRTYTFVYSGSMKKSPTHKLIQQKAINSCASAQKVSSS